MTINTEPIADMASMEERIHRVTSPFQTVADFVSFLGAVTLLRRAEREPGLALAWGLGQAMKAMLFGVTPTDWRLYLSMTALLAVVALVAGLVPARRAMSVDPVRALRAD